MALALIGESILAAVLEVLMERIVSPAVRDFFKSQKIDDEELKKLKARMRSVSKLLNDAEEKQIIDAAVKEWLDELKDAVYQADDFLDEIAYKSLGLNLEGESRGQTCTDQLRSFLASLNPCRKGVREVQIELTKILKDLEELVDQKDVLGLIERIGGEPSLRRTPTTSLVDESGVYGRAAEKEAIMKLLLSDDTKGRHLDLVELPANMGSLINLRHLDIQHTKLPEMPLQMGKLTKLRKLTDFFIGKQSGSSIKELGKVHHLSGALSVWNLQNVTDARDAFEANLKGKEHLEKLELIWDCDMDNSLVHERVLEQLQPPVNVKILSINGYGGTRFPDWVGNSSLPLLEELYIRSCPDLKKAVFTHFPSLTKLDIGACEQFEIEFFPLDLFPKLESLTIGSCPSLVSFSKGAPVAPNLKELKLRSCSNLKLLPENMRSFLPSLEKLSIFHCPKLESFPAGGLPSKLEGLAIWGCDKLVAGRTQWDLQSLHVLSRFSIAESDVLECFPEETLLPSSLAHLEIRTQKNLKSLNYKGLKHLTSLRELTIMNCMEVSMPEEGLPPSISSVTIWQCPLLEKECEMGMRKVPKYLRCPEYMIPGRKSV
ncbi:hypothetical protein DKX38_005126 [Salix brachista]|uniref:Uncharacterized protein n=1 Tax=Salix brachista TaxID=2182728 RepID=A0A5N5NCZ6_9ROSI|nr:hypothetical protein DKX38_005126 [Salix brachista]